MIINLDDHQGTISHRDSYERLFKVVAAFRPAGLMSDRRLITGLKTLLEQLPDSIEEGRKIDVADTTGYDYGKQTMDELDIRAGVLPEDQPQGDKIEVWFQRAYRFKKELASDDDN